MVIFCVIIYHSCWKAINVLVDKQKLTQSLTASLILNLLAYQQSAGHIAKHNVRPNRQQEYKKYKKFTEAAKF